MGLDYTDRGPQLGWNLNEKTLAQLHSIEDAWPHLLFQGKAMQATRELIPSDRSLIGFVGGPWTLFVYAVEGSHKGSLLKSKELIRLFRDSATRWCRCWRETSNYSWGAARRS